MTDIEEKIVEMKFNANEFDQGINKTMTSLDKLKNALNFNKESVSIDTVKSKFNTFNTFGLENSLNIVTQKFSALEVMGVTALMRITNAAITTGKRMTSALTIDPVKTGFNEYELKMGSVQTIMAGSGESLKTVNKYLNELNAYSDKTIYSFKDMTSNIGKFTNAGVKLKDAVAAIQGVSNEAALSGANAQEASRAMYNFAQALSAGYVKLIDWKSIENANMATVGFKNELLKTAEAEGTVKKTSEGMYEVLTTSGQGSKMKETINATHMFNDSLSYQWMTSEVLTKTLAKYADETTKIGKKATKAATEVKTFSMLWDTLKEAAQSGWAQTWELLVGDFEEAKKMLTEINDVVGKMIGDSADSRNKIISDFKNAGGRDDLIQIAKNIYHIFNSYLKPVREAFGEVFTPIQGKAIAQITKSIKEFTGSIKISNTVFNNIKTTFKGIFSIIDIGKKALNAMANILISIAKSDFVKTIIDLFLGLTAAIAELFIAIDKQLNKNGFSIIENLTNAILNVVHDLNKATEMINKIIKAITKNIVNVLISAFSIITQIITSITSIISGVSLSSLLASIIGAGFYIKLGKFVSKIISFIKQLGSKENKDTLDTFKENVSSTLNALQQSISAFTSNIKAATLLAIAGAMYTLTQSIVMLSDLDMLRLGKGLAAVAIGVTILMSAFNDFSYIVASTSKITGKKKNGEIIKSAISLVIIAKALKELAKAVKEFGDLAFEDLVKGLIGTAVGVQILIASLKSMSGFNSSIKASVSLYILSKALTAMSEALNTFSKNDEIGILRGALAMGLSLSIIEMMMRQIEEFSSVKSIAGIIVFKMVVGSLQSLSDSFHSFSDMDPDQMAKAASMMGTALIEVGAMIAVLSKVGGMNSIVGALSFDVLVIGLLGLAKAFKSFGEMKYDSIASAADAMFMAITEVVLCLGLLRMVSSTKIIPALLSFIVIVYTLDDLAKVFKSFATLTEDEIAKGLVAIGAGLAEMAVIVSLLGTFGNVQSIIGAASVLVMAQSLDDIANCLVKLGALSWDQVGRALTALGGALTEIAFGSFASSFGIIGSWTIGNTVGPLLELAGVIKKFASMSNEKVIDGVVNMGMAMDELASGTFANSLGILGSLSISTVAKPLGDLADSVSKWKDVVIPENMAENLGALAKGVNKFFLKGFGAGAIAEVAVPLGSLAKSVSKWKDITIPDEIDKKMATLANGVFNFTMSGFGASAIAESAGPIGQLAESVKKWNKVNMDKDVGTKLSSLAAGVHAFDFAFLGKFSLQDLGTSLDSLVEPIKKWGKVEFGDDRKEKLMGLAEAIKSFNSAFIGAWSLDSVASSMSKLSNAVVKFSEVKFSDDMGSGLTKFGDSILNLAEKLRSTSYIDGDEIKSFANGIGKLYEKVSSIKDVKEKTIDNFVNAVGKLSGINLNNESLKTTADGIAESTQTLVTTLTTSIKGSKSSIKKNMASSLKGIGDAIESYKETIATKIKVNVNQTVKNAIETFYDDFVLSGNYIVKGLIKGIDDKKTEVYNAAFELGQKAVQGERDGQKSKSPSREMVQSGHWLGEGLVIGMDDMDRDVYSAGVSMGKTATRSISSAISRIRDSINTDIDAQPTIRPVLDLTDIKDGAGSISTLFNNPNLGALGFVGASVDSRIQNGRNGDILSAIKDLGESIKGNTNSYTIGNINYESGSDVGQAIEALVNAVTVGGRI